MRCFPSVRYLSLLAPRPSPCLTTGTTEPPIYILLSPLVGAVSPSMVCIDYHHHDHCVVILRACIVTSDHCVVILRA